MGDRVVRLVGTAVLIAGLSTAAFVGVSVAAADDEPGAGGRGTTSSGEADSTGLSKPSAGQADSKSPTDRDAATGGIGVDPKPVQQGARQRLAPRHAVGTDLDASTGLQVPTGGGVVAKLPATEHLPTTRSDGLSEQPEPTEALAENDAAKSEPTGNQKVAVELTKPAPVVARPVAARVAVQTVAADTGAAMDVAAAEEASLAGAPGQAGTVAASTTLIATAQAAVGDQPRPVVQPPLAVTRAAAAPTPTPTGPTLINVLGSLAFSVFDYVNRVLQGPPVVPAGSGLKVGRSDLQIDCGDGYTAQADWYFPEDGEADKVIYFQHGILATSGYYNLTAAELAERNNAIVVAPTITSNFFACDACNLSGDQMHAAVGALFTGDRVALTASAQAAAQQAGVEFDGLPEHFVIAGHSAGGQLAAGAAGYFYDLAPDDEKSRLVGVLLFDTSASGGALGRALEKLPTALPVLAIAANPGPFNTYGNANDELEAQRPGQFNGVRLINGSHSDAFRSSTLFGFAQLVVTLGTGASTPENVEAVQVLAQGWIADMYAGTVYDPELRTGIYGPLGSEIEVPTAAGVARATVLPVPPAQLNPIDQVINVLLNSLTFLQGNATCAEDPGAVFARQMVGPEEISSGNASLSLDGRRQTVQSVGQHVCTG